MVRGSSGQGVFMSSKAFMSSIAFRGAKALGSRAALASAARAQLGVQAAAAGNVRAFSPAALSVVDKRLFRISILFSDATPATHPRILHTCLTPASSLCVFFDEVPCFRVPDAAERAQVPQS